MNLSVFDRRLFVAVAILVISFSGFAWEVQEDTAGPARPVSSLLNPDGTLNLRSGFEGNLDLSGFELVIEADGEPRFVPATRGTAAGDPEDLYWDDRFHLLGANGFIDAVAVDGVGNMYVGGAFTVIGNVFANRVAKWDGAVWSALGTGLDGDVHALAVIGGDLYVGGTFFTAGGVPASYIAKWSGSAWSAVGTGTDGTVFDLAVSGTDLYAGGSFSTAGGLPALRVAKWDGSGWSAVGTGMNGPVEALAVSGSDLYAGGGFQTAGGSSALNIAKWNGSNWSALGSGLNDKCYALVVSGTEVYAGGAFTVAGGVTVYRVAKWDGSSWSPTGPFQWTSDVVALAAIGGDVYVGGGNGLMIWDGSNATFPPTCGGVRALGIGGGSLYIASDTQRTGGSYCVTEWDGSNMLLLGTGLHAPVYAMAASDEGLYVGGYTLRADLSSGSGVARWDGETWPALGEGFDTAVLSLALSGGNLYAGGTFVFSGRDLEVNRIAKWDGTSWSALGTGMNSDVLALAAEGTNLYAGGRFTTAGGVPASRVAKWDGSSWSPLGDGTDGTVLALAANGDDVYAAGLFNTAGGVSVWNGIAKWDGTNWSRLGDPWDLGTSGWVRALAVSGDNLYAGGSFDGMNCIARWDGSSWSPLGSGMNEDVYAVAAKGNEVYAGGKFTTAGGVAVNHIARWDGEKWSGVGSGLGECVPMGPPGSRWVNALVLHGRDIYVGGEFLTAGGRVSAYIGQWSGVWDRDCDINGDGRVDEEDLILLQQNWHAVPYSSE